MCKILQFFIGWLDCSICSSHEICQRGYKVMTLNAMKIDPDLPAPALWDSGVTEEWRTGEDGGGSQLDAGGVQETSQKRVS